MITQEQIFNITRRASLEFNDQNPGFVAFRNMNPAAARSSVRKLVMAGFDAAVSPIDKQMIIVQN